MTFTQQHRVLIYTTCYNVLDGVTLTIRKLEQEILAAGHSVCILTTPSGDPANSHVDGPHPNRRLLFMDNAKPIPFLHDPHNPELSYKLGFNLSKNVLRQIEDFEPTLIHITVPDCTALHLIEFARRKEIPLMGTYHSNIPEYMDHYPGIGWLKPILGGFFKHQYNFMQALYVPTPFIRKHLVDTYQLDAATRLGVWGRGVDVEKFHPDYRYISGGKFRAQLGLDEDTVVICWVGRLVPEKRPDIFCDTVRRLHAQGLNFHAIVVGAGPVEDEVKGLPNTTFCGWMNAEQLAVAYASSDVFLFPSSVETFGNVTLEAMASGLPVVVEEGCSGHLAEEGVNGYACPAGDADAFYRATAELVRNTEKRMQYSYNSRLKAEQLEKRAVVRQMLQHYETVTDEFYTEYEGHHANRDKLYDFIGGNHPRPLLLVMVEYLFVVLFGVIFNMSQFFYMVQGSGATRGAAHSMPSISETAVPLRDNIVMSKPQAVLAESRDEEAPEDAAEDEQTKARCCKTKVVDIPTMLAAAFVSTMYIVCRCESRFRNGLKSCRTNTLRLRKRKNSFDLGSNSKQTEMVGQHRVRNLGSFDAAGSRHGGSPAAMLRRGTSMLEAPSSPNSGSSTYDDVMLLEL